MAQLALDRLRRKFGDAIENTHSQHGNETATVACDSLVQIAQFLRDDGELAFNLPVDNTAVDYWQKRPVRFEVIWHLYSITHKQRLRLKVAVPQEDPRCPSLSLLWPGFNWFERETWDLYGIVFVGHPNLKRVLMYEQFVGHPLRKDYPVDGRQPLVEMRQVRDVPTQRRPPPELLNRP